MRRLWLERSDRFVSAVTDARFGDAYTTGHPGVTTSWIAGIAQRTLPAGASLRERYARARLGMAIANVALLAPPVASRASFARRARRRGRNTPLLARPLLARAYPRPPAGRSPDAGHDGRVRRVDACVARRRSKDARHRRRACGTRFPHADLRRISAPGCGDRAVARRPWDATPARRLDRRRRRRDRRTVAAGLGYGRGRRRRSSYPVLRAVRSRTATPGSSSSASTSRLRARSTTRSRRRSGSRS